VCPAPGWEESGGFKANGGIPPTLGPPCGEGPRAGVPQGKQNGLKDAIQIPHHLGIRYAEDSEAIGRDPPIPDPVIFWRTRNGMRLAIDFDDQPGMMAGKIDVVWADPKLATEVMALLTQSAERRPEPSFRRRHGFSELAGAFDAQPYLPAPRPGLLLWGQMKRHRKPIAKKTPAGAGVVHGIVGEVTRRCRRRRPRRRRRAGPRRAGRSFRARPARWWRRSRDCP